MTSVSNDASGGFVGRGQSTLSAFFDDKSEAENAIRRLKDIGLADGQIRFMPGYEVDGDVVHADQGGFWAGLKDWFFSDEDRAAYAEGLRRGGFLISVQVDDQSYDSAHDILDDEGSIDMDERADLWRAEGWDGGRGNVTPREDALALAPETDHQTTAVANPASNRRVTEKSTPRVRAYRSGDVDIPQ